MGTGPFVLFLQLDVAGIGIYEPCNSVSNMAYYRTAMGVCAHGGWAMDANAQSALVQAYVALAMGSFFWHGSHSFLGNVADNRLIDVLAFVSFQVGESTRAGKMCFHTFFDRASGISS